MPEVPCQSATAGAHHQPSQEETEACKVDTQSAEEGEGSGFLYEKEFLVDKHHKRRNSKYIAKSPTAVAFETKFISRSKSNDAWVHLL